MQINSFQKFILIIICTILLLPWIPTFLDSKVDVIELTDELGFYQSYTCQISLFQFEFKNFFTTYQNHYRTNLNNYSEVPCYGKLTGLDRVGDIFYISIGMHPLITLILQSLFLYFLFLLFKKDNKKLMENNFNYYFSLLLTPLLITYGFYSQTRYYQRNFIDLDFRYLDSYVLIYIFVLFCTVILVESFNIRAGRIINYFPFLFIFIGVPFGLNLYIYFFIFITIGIYKTLTSYKTLNKLLFFLILVFIWISSVNNWFGIYFEGNIFYLKPDKMVGFISTVYTYKSVIYSSLLFFFLITGVFFSLDKLWVFVDIIKVKYNFYFVAVLLACLSFLNSEIQILNAFSQIYFGQNKASTLDAPSGLFDNWRGYFPSAEQMGEFYALVLIIFISLNLIKKLKFKKFELFPITVSIVFLILSNNRAAIISTIIFYLILILKFNLLILNKKFVTSLFSILVSFFVILYFNDLIPSFGYSSEKILLEANSSVVFQQYSSSLNYLNEKFNTSILTKIVFGIFSTVSLYINRSYLWGLFFARYNPTVKEFLFGSGPFQMSNLYNEIQIIETQSFLWIHSSFLQAFLYFGFLGITYLIFLIIKKYLKSISNYDTHIGRYILFFIIVNLFKSDSILYFSTFFTFMFFYTSLKFPDFKIINHKSFLQD